MTFREVSVGVEVAIAVWSRFGRSVSWAGRGEVVVIVQSLPYLLREGALIGPRSERSRDQAWRRHQSEATEEREGYEMCGVYSSSELPRSADGGFVVDVRQV